MFKKSKESVEDKKNKKEERITERKPKKKLPGWVILPILAVICLLFFGVSQLAGASEEEQLHVTQAQREDIRQVYHTSGIVESEKTKVFYSPVNAPVENNYVKVGSTVKAGDILVTFDTTNLERDNEQSQLNIQSARYSNQDTIAQSERAAASAAQAEQQAAASVQSLENQIAAKEAELNELYAQAEAEAAQAEQNQTEITNLQSQIAQLDEALNENEKNQIDVQTKIETAVSEEEKNTCRNLLGELEKEHLDLSNAKAGKENELSGKLNTSASETAQLIQAGEQELEALKSSLTSAEGSAQTGVSTGLTDAQRKNMQVSENLAELAGLSTEELLAKGKEGVRAEFDGVIADTKLDASGMVVQGGELFTLASTKEVCVKLEVSANDFDNLVIGSSADIKIGQYSYQGTLKSVNKIAVLNQKGNPVIGAEIHVDNPDENICIGVSAKVELAVADKEMVLCIPSEVVYTSADGDFVYVLRDGIVEKQEIELGIASDSKVEVVKGLQVGDKVVSDTSDNIREGMKASAIIEEAVSEE